jgi:hypothetical protein
MQKKWSVLAVMSFLSFSLPAFSFNNPLAYLNCPQASSTDDPAFCASFKTSAICHCVASGLPSGMCQSIKRIHDLMLARYGSEQRACENQHDTSTQNCLDDWQCYHVGGTDTQGRLCNSTGNACEPW